MQGKKYTHVKSLSSTPLLLYSLYHTTPLHLSVQEVAILVNILNRLLRNTVPLLLPRQRRVREHTRAWVRGAGLACGRALLVFRTVRKRCVDGSRRVSEGLAGGLVLGGLGQLLVGGRQVGELVVRGGGGDLGALGVDVEVGDVVWVELAVDADDLVVQVLGEVGLDVIGVEGLDFACGFLALEAGRQGESAFGHDGVGGVAAAAGLHATKDTVGTDVVGVLSVVGRWVVVSLAAGTVGVGSGGVGDWVRGSRVRVGGGRVRGRVRARLADEAVNGVRSVHSELVSNNGKNVVVVTLLERTALVLAGLVGGLVVSTLGQSALASTVEASDSASNLGVGALAGLRVVVSENTGLTDILGGEVVTLGVLGEGFERSVAVLGLTLLPLGHSAVDVAVGDVGVGDNQLVHGKQTVNVGVVEPEDGVEGRDVEVVHVATSLTASGVVNDIVDRLEAVNTGAAQLSANTDLRGGGGTPGLLAGEQSENTVTERHAHGVEAGVHFIVVAAGRVGNRTTKGVGPAVPWATSYLGGKRATPAVRVERVGNGDSTRGLGNGDSLVTDQSGNGSTAIVLRPIPVGHAQSRRSLLPSATLAGGEGVDDLLNALVQGLLEDGKVGPVPRTK